ncbi:tetratricopeptide repeat protein [Streptomyces nitrosporeus]|uniref:tetratricopeptide repeat protein n=1 Tax=Streptomyces nitrosporeus TaxID=28894 RepID=UPI00331D1C28
MSSELPGTGAAGTALCVVCEEYADGRRFPRLAGAVAQMDEIAGLLEGLGYEARKVGGGNPSAARYSEESDAWCEGWLATGAGRPAVVLWSGHGVLADGALRLVLPDLELSGDPLMRGRQLARHGVDADELVGTAVATGADHVLVIIDTCYAGDAVARSVETALKRWETVSMPPGRTKWLGIMASCQRNETSDGSGPLLAAFAEVLRDGPGTTGYRSAWSGHNAFVGGADLLDALAGRWRGEGQTPVPATLGTGRPVFPNPRHRPGAPAGLVEHLVLAARGVGHREEGWFFTGRDRVLGEIAEWMGTDRPGLFLVTGPAGCGKSAVLGRVATLLDPVLRAEAEERGALREGDTDPGSGGGRTLAAVHLRGLTPLQAAAELARGLGLHEPRNADDFRGELRESALRPVLVLDGLDEVSAEHAQAMVEELVFPLSRTVPVLLGSRDRPFRNRLDAGETLPQALTRLIGADVTTADLEREPRTREDIGTYVFLRCTAAGVPEPQAREVAAAVSGRATALGGGFLFARLVTGTVLRDLGEKGRTGEGGPLSGLPGSIGAAFENELRSGPVRVREDGTALPSAARDLLTALAWSVGRGMPADGVWEAVAGALGGGAVYDGSDVDWLLSAYGRYVVEDAEDGRAVYRLYHREFVSHLMRRSGPGGADADRVVTRTLVDLAARRGPGGEDGPYLSRGLVLHAVRTGEPGIGMLRELAAGGTGGAPGLLAEALVHFSLVLSREGERDEALRHSREAASLYRGLAGSRPEEYRADLAGALNVLADRLADTGDRAEALATAREAVALNRALAGQHPAVFLLELAKSLNNLANHLSSSGDREGALAAVREAVETYRPLAEENRTALLPDFASILGTLASHLADTGDREGALAPAHEAVVLHRALAEQHPAAFLPNLAKSLNNLAGHRAETGDREGALAPAREAVDLYRTLAGQHPAAFLPDLAMSLHNLARHLGDAGDREGALALVQEAVRILRALTERHPAAFLPDLALSLNNLASHRAETGDREGALAPAREAVDLYRTLAGQHPAAFLPDLAMSLHNLARHLAGADDGEDVLTPAREAVGLYRALAGQHPAAFLPGLAKSLTNLASHLSDAGEHAQALAISREAVGHHRALAERHPAAFLPDLAMSLHNLANHLAATGEREDVLAPAREAVRIRRALAEEHPAAFLPDLAASLDALAAHLAGSDDFEGALAPAREAVGLHRTLAGQRPATFLSDLAASLNALAAYLSGKGDREHALPPAREAVDLYRSLAEGRPAAFLPGLAMSLHDLATHLVRRGDREEALAPATEAVALYRTLTGQRPAVFLPDLVVSLSSLAGHLADAGDVASALQAYTAATEDLTAVQPEAGRVLALEHAVFLLRRPECPAEEGITRLAGLLGGSSAGRTGEPDLRAHTAIRAYVQENPRNRAVLDSVWQSTTGEPAPPWATLTPEVMNTVKEWLATPTWAASSAYWAEHAGVLSGPGAVVALTEYTLLSPRVAAGHLQLREQISSEGAEAAFRPLLVDERLSAWSRCASWEESERFLRADPGLLDAELPAYAPPLQAALLHVARTRDIATAYALARDPGALQEYTGAAVAAGDAEALRHVSVIEETVHADPLSSSVHAQAALVLAGTAGEAAPERLVPLVADAPAEVRNRLIAETATLSARYAPEHSALWARIIQTLAGAA